MLAFSSSIIPMARNICPRFCRTFSPNGIYRNYWRRRDSFADLSSALQSMENYAKEVDREMNRMFGEFQRASPVKLPRMLSPFDWGRVREIPVVSDEGDNKYKLELDMEGMEPENINITLKDNELTVTARREEKREDGSRFLKENTYHYTLPNEINPDTIRSTLVDGVLAIEAQIPALEPKEIPVNREDTQKINSGNDKTSK